MNHLPTIRNHKLSIDATSYPLIKVTGQEGWRAQFHEYPPRDMSLGIIKRWGLVFLLNIGKEVNKDGKVN